MQNVQLINAIKGANTGATWVSITEINTFLGGFGIPPFIVPTDGQPGGSIYASSFDVDGVTTPAFATNKLAFLPADLGTLGFTAWGVPTTTGAERQQRSGRGRRRADRHPGARGSTAVPQDHLRRWRGAAGAG